MAAFKPALPYSVAAKIMKPEYREKNGRRQKKFPEVGEIGEAERINCSFKTFGGTEQEVNGVYAVIDTANIETYYRPDIKSDCGIVLLENGAKYEIIGEPENIDMKNQYMKFKVKRIKGGA